MISILVEQNYKDNLRFLQLTEGITSRQRHRSDVEIYGSVEEIPNDSRPVILVSQSMSWAQKRIGELCRAGFYPIVFGHSRPNLPYRYCCVLPDYTRAAYRLTRHLITKKSGGRVAILGYNGDSMPDRLKYIGIKEALAEAGASHELFKNFGNIGDCLSGFSSRADGFDVAVCCNDNIAVALTALYPELSARLTLGSCSGSKISEFFENPYPVCRIDYIAAGEMLARLSDLVARDSSLYSGVITLDMQTNFEDCELSDRPDGGEVDFYGDKGLLRMERLNAMLEYADDCDLAILDGLVRARTYVEIADACFIAEGTVKYRTKKLLEHAGVATKRELVDMLSEFGIAKNLVRRERG